MRDEEELISLRAVRPAESCERFERGTKFRGVAHFRLEKRLEKQYSATREDRARPARDRWRFCNLAALTAREVGTFGAARSAGVAGARVHEERAQ